MRLLITIFSLLALSGLILFNFANVRPEVSSQGLAFFDIEEDISQFARVYGPRELEFPQDLGAHPDYQTEWWYYTGNLAADDGHRYGFEFTIFRRALSATDAGRTSEWANSQVYFAHFAVSDLGNQTFYHFERFSRAGAGLAGAQGDPYHVWLENWSVQETEAGQIRLYAQTEGVTLDLLLDPIKPMVLQGDQGYSPKSDEPGNASYYYSFTRIQAEGQVSTPDGTAQVTGLAWKDHEWSTSALGPGAIGWDWFALQLDDDREIMYYLVRRDDGTYEPISEGVIVNPDGSTQRIGLKDATVTVLERWTSPHSGGTYPIKWTISIPEADIDLTVTAMMKDQEMNVSTVYWEGAVQIEGTQSGYGYVEMTGYAGELNF